MRWNGKLYRQHQNFLLNPEQFLHLIKVIFSWSLTFSLKKWNRTAWSSFTKVRKFSSNTIFLRVFSKISHFNNKLFRTAKQNLSTSKKVCFRVSKFSDIAKTSVKIGRKSLHFQTKILRTSWTFACLTNCFLLLEEKQSPKKNNFSTCTKNALHLLLFCFRTPESLQLEQVIHPFQRQSPC